MQSIVGQIQIVTGVEVCDNIEMENSIARSSETCEVPTDIVAVTDGGVNVSLGIIPAMARMVRMSDDILDAMFLQAEGTLNSRDAMLLNIIGSPLGCGGLSSSSRPGLWSNLL